MAVLESGRLAHYQLQLALKVELLPFDPWRARPVPTLSWLARVHSMSFFHSLPCSFHLSPASQRRSS